MRKIPQVTALLILLSVLSPAEATTDYPAQSVYALLNQGKPEEAYRLLLSQESRWGSHPDYNYLLGVASLQTSHYSQARTAFERSILLDPSNAGAYLDLAITLIELQRYNDALKLLNDVEQHFNPPLAIQNIINRLHKRIESETSTEIAINGSVFGGSGYSSNVNNGTYKSLIQLDLGEGPIPLPVSDTSKSSSDSYYEAGGTLNGALRYNEWRLQLLSAVQQRQYNSMSEFDTLNLFAGTNLQRVTEHHLYETGINYSQVWLDSDDYQHSTSGQIRYRYRFDNGLRLSGQWKLNQTRYAQTANNDMDYSELYLSASYPLSLFNYSSLLHSGIRLTQGSAQNNRAGGDQDLHYLNLSLVTQISTEQLIRLNAFIGRDEDSAPYNATLFGNQIRETDKWGVSAGYTYYFTPELSATLRLSHERTDSSIDLFTTKTTQARLRLNYTF